jgi:hypothetical protein
MNTRPSVHHEFIAACPKGEVALASIAIAELSHPNHPTQRHSSESGCVIFQSPALPLSASIRRSRGSGRRCPLDVPAGGYQW